MTFTPQVLTQTDNNNSTIFYYTGSNPYTQSSYEGTSTVTTGYNTLILTIKSDVSSDPGGIKISFSDDNSTWVTPYTDTYFSSNIFTKTYLIIKKYYKIVYTRTTTSANPTYITSRLSTDLDSSITQNTSITVFDNNVENTLDAFGKLRVSMPTTLLDIRFPGQASGDLEFRNNNLQITSTSSGSYSGAYSNSKLVVSAQGSGYYISQSRNYCVYQPGKSLLFLASGVLYPGNDAYTTRIGYFDNETPLSNNLTVRNGLYFEHSNGEYSVNIKNDLVTQILQDDWNIDKMDGFGPSGLDLNFTNTQLFVIDMEWLGVGRIRFGFYAYGRIQYCHQVTNINGLTQPYTNSINLPICYSIHNTASTITPANAFTQICSTVISEGGYTPLGRPFTISNGNAPVQVSNSEKPLLFLTGGSANYYHQNIIPTSVTTTSSSTNDFMIYRLRLYLGGTYPYSVGGSITWIDVDTTYSVCKYSTQINSPGTFSTTGSIIIDQNYFFGRGTNSFNPLGDVFSTQILQITSNILNESDILVLTCEKLNSSSDSPTYGIISWQEIY